MRGFSNLKRSLLLYVGQRGHREATDESNRRRQRERYFQHGKNTGDEWDVLGFHHVDHGQLLLTIIGLPQKVRD